VSSLPLPSFLQHRIDAVARSLIEAHEAFDFTRPEGEQALVPADSISWRIFKNPLAVFIGGVAAVILELAEPRVRTGVWEHSSFRDNPVRRLQRTGLAAMITVYGPHRAAQEMIARIVVLHEKVSGTTPAGIPYRASDPELLTWVHATASFGFSESHHRYVRPLTSIQRDRVLREGQASAQLYGATMAPKSDEEWRRLFASAQVLLEPSAILHEFLSIMRTTSAFPVPLRPMQRLLVRAAVDLLPAKLLEQLGIDGHGLRPGEEVLVRAACALADRILLNSSPAVQACRRLGLPADYLYRAE
jgi:uncharacterized protein (DUF2236 family)